MHDITARSLYQEQLTRSQSRSMRCKPQRNQECSRSCESKNLGGEIILDRSSAITKSVITTSR